MTNGTRLGATGPGDRPRRALDERGARTASLPTELIAAREETAAELLAEEAAKDADFARVLAPNCSCVA